MAVSGWPGGRLLQDGFLRSLARDPDAEALRIGPRGFSYGRLHARASALAGALAAGSTRPLRRVGLLASRTEDAYAGMLAALYTGAAVVPLHPDFPAAHLRYMITAASLDGLLADRRGTPVLAELADVLDGVAVVTGPEGGAPAEPVRCSADDVAYVLFTSGSSGRPKGVPVRHASAAAYLRHAGERYDFTPGDVFSQTFDLTFDLAVFDLFAGWGSGGTVVCVPPQGYADVPGFVARHGITVWFSAPRTVSLVRRLSGLAPGCLPSLRWSLFCGEALLVRDAAEWQRAAPRSAVENLYGPTELTISCSAHRYDPLVSPRRAVNGVVPIGTVHPNLRYLLLGAEEDGEGTGELCVSGEQTFPGYLDPADDTGRFLDREGERYYRTGDLVRRTEGGELAFIGRRDHQVSIGGVRVELAEVEAGLRRLPGVRDAVAVAVDGRLVAFCVGEQRPTPALVKAMGSLVPRPLVPQQFAYVDTLPLNSNGKTDRLALRTRAERLLGG